MNSKRISMPLLLLLVGSVIFSATAFHSEYPAQKVSRMVRDAIVRVETIDEQYSGYNIANFWQKELVTTSNSGFLIDKEGYLITTFDAVQDAKLVKVFLADETEYNATVIGKDRFYQLALCKIEGAGRDLPYVEFADSDNTRQGEPAVAVGSPYRLESTVTYGIISARRNIRLVGPNNIDGKLIPDALQTDAPINPGSLGGGLFNTDGQLVGVPMVMAQNRGKAKGISYAIPSNIVIDIAHQLKETSKVFHPWLGIAPRPMDEYVAVFADVPEKYEGMGVYVIEVSKGSPAAKAGLASEDIIMEFNGEIVEGILDLEMRILALDKNERFDLTYLRVGADRTQVMYATITVADRASDKFALIRYNIDPTGRLTRLGTI
jgi:serine protease Do